MGLLYIIFFFLILRFTVTLFNFISNPKLPLSGKHYDDRVSILIPLKNKTDNILPLLQSIRAQDYKNYEVLIIKDTDTADEVYEAFCKENQYFKLVNLPDLPVGWTEKNFSCYQLSKAATGKYFMFLDSAVIVANGLINNAVHRMKIQRLTLLSLFTSQLMLSIGERLVVPLINFLLLNLVPLRLIRLSKNPVFAIASGQFMMFDAKSYIRYNWHEAVRNKRMSDLEIIKLIKGYGYNAETLLANGFIYSRMYTGFTDAIQGLSKNIMANFGSSVGGLFLYIFLVILGPVAIAAYMSTELLLFAITLIVLSRIMISLLSGQNTWLNVVFHPIQMLSLVLIAILSVQNHFTKTIIWKQRKVRY